MDDTKRNPDRTAPGVEESIPARQLVAGMFEEMARVRIEEAVIDPALRAESVRLRDKAARGEPLEEEEVTALWHMVRKVKSLLGGDADGVGVAELNGLMECDRVLDETVEKETILLGLDPAELMTELRRGDSPAWYRFRMAAGLRNVMPSPATTGGGNTEAVFATPSSSPAATFSPAKVRQLTGFSPNTVNKYAKKAGVRRPKRGERNFLFTEAEVRQILNAIISESSSTRDGETAQKALRHLG